MTLEEKIVDFITRHYRGNKNAISAAQIATIISGVGYSTTSAEVQRMIGDIRRAKIALIGSSPSGFFLILTEEDMAITQANIKNRIKKIVEASEALNEKWEQENGVKPTGDLFSGNFNVK